jgi:hypothetical protein
LIDCLAHLPFDCCIHLPLQQGYEVAHACNNLKPNECKSKLDSLLAGIPTETLSVPDFKHWQGPQVESEHWVMRELGYQGPIPYADKIKGIHSVSLTSKPHSNRSQPGLRICQLGFVKPEVLRKHVEKHRKELEHPLMHGRALVWVSLSEHQIGEESVLDDPQHTLFHEGAVETGEIDPWALGCSKLHAT